jgi:transcription antitermination factor NusG
MLKVSDNPPMLTPTARALSDLRGQWWVACTRGQHEKALARYLLARGLGYFLPMHERVTFWRREKRRSLLPLFPCYVFLCGDEHDRLIALQSNRVFRAIEVVNQPQLVAELTAIETALAGKAELELYPSVAVGQCCRITAGPFEGLEGIVVERRSRARFVLRVGILGQGAAMLLDGDLLQTVD